MPDLEAQYPFKFSESIWSTCSSPDGLFVAIIFSNSKSIVHVYSSKDPATCIKTLHVPGYSADHPAPASLVVCCAWSPVPEDGLYQLAIASSQGHVSTCLSGSWEVFIAPQTNLRLMSRNFHQISVLRDSLIVASNHELVVWTRSRKPGRWELAPNKPVVVYSPTSGDHAICLDVHFSGCAAAICSLEKQSVIIVGLSNARPDLNAQLRQTPREVTESSGQDMFVTPAELEDEDSFGPSVLNQVKLADQRRPIACSWSKYGETLAIASSDNLLSIWNIPGRTMETVAVGEDDVIIRNVRFISDVIVAVALSDSNRLLLVDVDEGVLYEPDSLGDAAESSKNRALDFSAPKGSSKLVLARPGHDQLRRWLVGL